MRTIFAIVILLLLVHCQSYSIRKFEVLQTTKDGKVIYTVDATDQRYLIKYPVDGLICVANNEGDLICR